MKKINKKDLSLQSKEVSNLSKSELQPMYDNTNICGPASIPPACDPTVVACGTTRGIGCGDGTNASKCLCTTENGCSDKCGTEGTSARVDLECPVDTKQECIVESQYLKWCVEPISFNNDCATDGIMCANPIETFDLKCNPLLTNEEECAGTDNCPGIMSEPEIATCPCLDPDTNYCV